MAKKDNEVEKTRVNVSFPFEKHERLMIRKVLESRDQMDILGDGFELYESVLVDVEPREAKAIIGELVKYSRVLVAGRGPVMGADHRQIAIDAVSNAVKALDVLKSKQQRKKA